MGRRLGESGRHGRTLAPIVVAVVVLAGCEQDRVSCCWEDVVVERYHACGIVRGERSVECWGALLPRLGNDPESGWVQQDVLLAPPSGPMGTLASGGPAGENCGIAVGGEFRCSDQYPARSVDGTYAADPPLPTDRLYHGPSTGRLVRAELGGWARNACALLEGDKVGAACWGIEPSSSPCDLTHCALFQPPGGLFEDLSLHGYTACARRAGTLSWDCWGGDEPREGLANSWLVFDGAMEALEAGEWLDLDLNDNACGLDPQGVPLCMRFQPPSVHPLSSKLDLLEPSWWRFDGGYTQISVASTHACAVHESGVVDCLPSDDPDVRPSSALFPDERFVQVRTAENATCALRDDGALRCWGKSPHGQLAPPDPGGAY